VSTVVKGLLDRHDVKQIVESVSKELPSDLLKLFKMCLEIDVFKKFCNDRLLLDYTPCSIEQITTCLEVVKEVAKIVKPSEVRKIELLNAKTLKMFMSKDYVVDSSSVLKFFMEKKEFVDELIQVIKKWLSS